MAAVTSGQPFAAIPFGAEVVISGNREERARFVVSAGVSMLKMFK